MPVFNLSLTTSSGESSSFIGQDNTFFRGNTGNVASVADGYSAVPVNISLSLTQVFQSDGEPSSYGGQNVPFNEGNVENVAPIANGCGAVSVHMPTSQVLKCDNERSSYGRQNILLNEGNVGNVAPAANRCGAVSVHMPTSKLLKCDNERSSQCRHNMAHNIGNAINDNSIKGANNEFSVATSSSERLVENLVLHLHAYKCERMNCGLRRCAVPDCSALKRVAIHMVKCEAGDSCNAAFCASSKKTFIHVLNCKQSDCEYCAPLKQSAIYVQTEFDKLLSDFKTKKDETIAEINSYRSKEEDSFSAVVNHRIARERADRLAYQYRLKEEELVRAATSDDDRQVEANFFRHKKDEALQEATGSRGMEVEAHKLGIFYGSKVDEAVRMANIYLRKQKAAYFISKAVRDYFTGWTTAGQEFLNKFEHFT